MACIYCHSLKFFPPFFVYLYFLVPAKHISFNLFFSVAIFYENGINYLKREDFMGEFDGEPVKFI